jgi:hypothetical protein
MFAQNPRSVPSAATNVSRFSLVWACGIGI